MNLWWKSYLAGLKSSWQRELLRHLPLLLSLFAIMQIFQVLSYLMSSKVGPPSYPSNLHILKSVEVLLVPLMAINAIFWAQRWWTTANDTGWFPVLLKSMATVIGVFVGTAILEWFYLISETDHNNQLVFGAWSLSPVTSSYVWNILLGLIIGVPTFIRQSRRQVLQNQLVRKQLEVSNLEQMKTRAELLALQARINPHFLYNSLNSIAALIHQKPNQAEKMVMHLADLFRYSLNTKGQHWSNVGEEIDMVLTYLEVERVRFGDQLKVELDYLPELRHLPMPRFLLQPLVENALKHGTSLREEGLLRLKISLENELLIVFIGDNGPPFPDQQINGYGWQSTYDKLQLLYKGKHSIYLQNEPEKAIRIEIPTQKPEYDEAIPHFNIRR